MKTIFWAVVWALAFASALGMTLVPLSLFIEDRLKHRRKK